MADNVELNAGTGGATCATDDCGAAGHTQRVKLSIATDGSATAIPADAKGLQVQQPTAADFNCTEASADAIKTAVEVLDNCIAGSEAQVDVVTVPAPLSLVGGGVEAAALRVTLASDSTGVVSVDDNGSALTVDGTVTANAGTNLNTSALALEAGGNLAGATTSLAVLDDWDESDRAKVNPIAGQAGIAGGAGAVGATVPRVTLASDDPAVTALQIMDDWDNGASDGASVSGDVAHDGADAGEPVKIGFKNKLFDGSAPGATVSAEDDRANAICDGYGRQYVEITHPNYWWVSADYGAAQTNASIKAAPGANLCLFVTDIVISNGAVAGNITLLDGSGGAVLFELYPAINGGVAISLRTPIKLTANTALCITSTTVTTHSVNIGGFTAAVTGGI